MSIAEIFIQALMAGIASAGFSVFYRVPWSEYLYCGIGGALCWAVYIVAGRMGVHETIAVFLAAIVVSIAARFLAKRRRYPVTVFLVSSIFPLVPGSYIYYTVYYLLHSEAELSSYNLQRTFQTAIAIAFGIMIVTSFPSIRKKSK